MFERITVYFGGRGKEQAGAADGGQFDAVHHAQRIGRHRGKRLAAVVDRACGRCKMHDEVGRIEPRSPRPGKRNVGLDELERQIAADMLEIEARSRCEIVDADHAITVRE